MVRSDVPVWVNSALLFQDQWRKIGLDVQVEQAEFGASISRMLQGDYDVRIGGIAFNTTDPDHYLWAHFTTDGPNNLRYATDPEVDRLLAAQRVELDPARRRELAHQARDAAADGGCAGGGGALRRVPVRRSERGAGVDASGLHGCTTSPRWDGVWLRGDG